MRPADSQQGLQCWLCLHGKLLVPIEDAALAYISIGMNGNPALSAGGSRFVGRTLFTAAVGGIIHRARKDPQSRSTYL